MNKERPIIFNAEMVRAILADRKTQTRRVIKPQPDRWLPPFLIYLWNEDQFKRIAARFHCPYGKPGDTLWIRETWHAASHYDELKPSLIPAGSPLWYAAKSYRDHDGWAIRGKKRPSIFMPRWASRITLEITDVRVERVQDISAHDAISEGINPEPHQRCGDFFDDTAVDEFTELWNSINTKRGFGWDVNPWCWCISFRTIEHGHIVNTSKYNQVWIHQTKITVGDARHAAEVLNNREGT